MRQRPPRGRSRIRQPVNSTQVAGRADRWPVIGRVLPARRQGPRDDIFVIESDVLGSAGMSLRKIGRNFPSFGGAWLSVWSDFVPFSFKADSIGVGVWNVIDAMNGYFIKSHSFQVELSLIYETGDYLIT